MALIYCPECHEEISSRATICPECAKPIRSERAARTLGLRIVIVVAAASAVLVSVIVSITRPPSPPSPLQADRVAGASADRSDQMQKQRWQLIQRRLREGVFAKIEAAGNLPRVWVTERFKTLDLDSKQTLISVVYVFYLDATNDTYAVRLLDTATDKEIGVYRFPDRGLELY